MKIQNKREKEKVVSVLGDKHVIYFIVSFFIQTGVLLEDIQDVFSTSVHFDFFPKENDDLEGQM